MFKDIPNTIRNKNGSLTTFVYDLEAINNSINNIILTPEGSLPGKPDFGTNLQKYIFEDLNPLTVELIREEIITKLNMNEPRITVNNINIKKDLDYNKVLISVIFVVNNTFSTTEETVNVSVSL